jgi:hypothetical protein
MKNRIGVERINEFPAKRIGGKVVYMYLCPCGETKWGSEQRDSFKTWRAHHITRCCGENARPVLCLEGTQRELIDMMQNSDVTIMFLFHDRSNRRTKRHTWYAVQRQPGDQA